MTQTMAPPQQQATGQPVYEITEADKKRVQEIADTWKAVDGLLDPPLKKMPEGTDPNVMSNRCEPIVERGIDFLFGQPVGISCEQGAPSEAQDFLEQTWGKNETRLPLLQDLAHNGAVAGRAFLRIVPNQDGTDFRLVVVDPSTVYVQTARQDCETVLLYCIEYSVVEKVNGKPAQVYYREEIARIDPDGNASQGMPDDDDTWSIQHWTRVGDRGLWTSAGEPILWPYPFAPLFSCKNRPRPNDFWGKPDITQDLINLNKALNLSLSCSNEVQILYGQPILYATGIAESAIDIKPGRIIGMPTSDGKIVAVAIASDLANSLSFQADLRSDMDEQSAVPAVALGRLKDIVKGRVSGITMELMFQPLLQKTEKKRCLYGALLIEVSKALLVLGKFSPDIEVSLEWQDPLPHDDLETVNAVLAKQKLGVSNETLIAEMGYDAQMEMDRANTEAAQKMRIAMMPPAQPGQPTPPPTQSGKPPMESPFMVRS